MTVRSLRKDHKISESTLQRLNLYALAAGAAGVSLLAMAPPAEAEVVYTHFHLTLTGEECYYLDLNNDGTKDFQLCNIAGGGVYTFQSVKPLESAHQKPAVLIKSPYAAPPLNRGVRIGLSKQFSTCFLCSSFGFLIAGVRSSQDFGSWVNVSDRFMGLELDIRGEKHFGWARFSVAVKGATIITEINGYAYETTPDQLILAGQTSGTTDDPVFVSDTAEAQDTFPRSGNQLVPERPQSGSLGILALGAPGIPFWRRRVQPGASQSKEVE